MMKRILSLSLLLVTSAFAGKPETQFPHFAARTGCEVAGNEFLIKLLKSTNVGKKTVRFGNVNLVRAEDGVFVLTRTAEEAARDFKNEKSVKTIGLNALITTAKTFTREKTIQFASYLINTGLKKAGFKTTDEIKKDNGYASEAIKFTEYATRYGIDYAFIIGQQALQNRTARSTPSAKPDSASSAATPPVNN